MIVTIDGPAGAGKSSSSRLISEKLKMSYYNSGLTYRGIAFAILDMIDLGSTKEIDEKQISDMLDKIEVYNTGQSIIYKSKVVPEEELRSSKINSYVGILSKLKSVREKSKKCLKAFMEKTQDNIVFEGRDMGTAIFPNADTKFYLVSTLEERSKRRARMDNNNYQEAMKNVVERDKHDKDRVESPLKMPEDAILVDNSEMTLEQTVTKMIRIIEEKRSCGKL